MTDSAETMRDERSPYDGKPYYCKVCGLGLNEYMACDDVVCELETASSAVARARAKRNASGTKSDGTAGKDADPQRNRLLGEDTPEKGAGVAPGPSDWTPSELLYFGLADATKVRIRLERGHGSIVHVFDRADIKHLRNALRPSDPIPSQSAEREPFGERSRVETILETLEYQIITRDEAVRLILAMQAERRGAKP